MIGSSGAEHPVGNAPLTWFPKERDGWLVDFVRDRVCARERTGDGVMVIGVERRKRYCTLIADLMLANHDFTPTTRERLRELVSPLRKAHPSVRAIVSAMTFRLCVPNQEVEQIKEGIRTLLSEDNAYAWHQRPLAASRRGIVREVEEDEIEHRKLYPPREFFA